MHPDCKVSSPIVNKSINHIMLSTWFCDKIYSLKFLKMKDFITPFVQLYSTTRARSPYLFVPFLIRFVNQFVLSGFFLQEFSTWKKLKNFIILWLSKQRNLLPKIFTPQQ